MAELTQRILLLWKIEGRSGGRARNAIFPDEWDALCDLALRGLESERQDVAAPTSAVSIVTDAVGKRSDDRPSTEGGRDAKQVPAVSDLVGRLREEEWDEAADLIERLVRDNTK